MKNPTSILRVSAVLRHRVGFIRNGKRYLRPWVDNLILDSGLNKAGTQNWSTCFTYCLFGNQVAPEEVRRDSGGITFTVTGTACVASGNFFVPTDTGRLIKFNDTNGQERYLTYVSAVAATLSSAATGIAAETGTVWYVNQTALQSLLQATDIYDQTGGSNGTTRALNVTTMKRTYIGTAVGGATTLTEIGFSSSAANTNIFDRDIIPGGVALASGDIPTAICHVVLTVYQTTPVAVGNVGTACDTTGNFQVTTIQNNDLFGFIDANGNSSGASGSYSFEGPSLGGFCAALGTFTLPPFGSPTAGPTTVAASSTSVSAYGPGNFYRDKTYFFATTAANGTHHGVMNVVGAQFCWAQLFTNPFAKSSAQQLTYVMRLSWQRDLVN